MNVRRETSIIRNFVAEMFEDMPYAKEAGIIILLAVAGVGGFWGYRMVVARQEQAAQRVFAAALEEYERVERLENPNWSEVAEIFKLGYEEHRGSSWAPYFLAKQADALLEDGKKTEAMQVMDQVINVLSSSAAMMNAYKTKRALIMLDMTDAQMQADGLQALQELAQDSSNGNRDLAGFFLGQYYLSHNETGKARAAWQQLVAQASQEQAPQSPWADRAQEMLTLIA